MERPDGGKPAPAPGAMPPPAPAKEGKTLGGAAGSADRTDPADVVGLLGPQLVVSGVARRTEAVVGAQVEVVALLFGSARFDECQAATKAVMQWVGRFKATSPHAGGLEVVYVHQDVSEASFTSSVALHPWPLIPYGSHRRCKGLMARCSVFSLPALVLVDRAGRVRVADGLHLITHDDGRGFPWAPTELTLASLPGILLCPARTLLGLVWWVVSVAMARAAAGLQSLASQGWRATLRAVSSACGRVQAAVLAALRATVLAVLRLVWLLVSLPFRLLYRLACGGGGGGGGSGGGSPEEYIV